MVQQFVILGTFASRPLPMENMPGFLKLLSSNIVVQVFEFRFGSTFSDHLHTPLQVLRHFSFFCVFAYEIGGLEVSVLFSLTIFPCPHLWNNIVRTRFWPKNWKFGILVARSLVDKNRPTRSLQPKSIKKKLPKMSGLTLPGSAGEECFGVGNFNDDGLGHEACQGGL